MYILNNLHFKLEIKKVQLTFHFNLYLKHFFTIKELIFSYGLCASEINNTPEKKKKNQPNKVKKMQFAVTNLSVRLCLYKVR